MLGGIQGGTIAVIVKKSFSDVPDVPPHQLNFAIGVVSASQAIGMLTSFLWASASRGCPKVKWISTIQLATAATVLLMAFTPRSLPGLWWIVGLCMLARIFWSGVTTLRAGVLRANYARAYRPSIFSRLTILQSLIIAFVGGGIGFVLDRRIENFRLVFPALALTGSLGAIAYGRVPFRREAVQLSIESAPDATRFGSYNPMRIIATISNDRWFRGYLCWMFFVGMGNLMIQPIVTIVLAEQFDASYQESIAITTVIPLVCMTFALPAWARRLEREHVIHYRAFHAWSFCAVSASAIAAIVSNQIGFLYVSAVAMGLAFAGGAPAWNLGHQHFAPRDRDAEYMAAHITLSGIRGILAPLISVGLYQWLAPYHRQVWAFAACGLLNFVGAFGFHWLARQFAAEGRPNDRRPTDPV